MLVIGWSVVSVCVCVCVCVCVHTLKGTAANLVHIYSMAVAWQVLTQWSKSQGHTVMKTITVAWLLVKCATAADMGLHVVWLLRFLAVMLWLLQWRCLLLQQLIIIQWCHLVDHCHRRLWCHQPPHPPVRSLLSALACCLDSVCFLQVFRSMFTGDCYLVIRPLNWLAILA